MNIKIKSLRIENFKGIKFFDSNNWDGKNIDVFGDNATGKTTLEDAFQWALFDKNAEGNSKFGIKPKDKNGNEFHNLETTVFITLLINDEQTITLKKVYKEKWQKRRGEEEQELTGHTTDYFFNGTPLQQREYKDRINALIEEELFKMITSPTYFNTLSTKEKRNVILKLVPDITNEELLNKNSELSELMPLLLKKSIEDIKKTAINEKKEFAEKVKEIPARIDELSKQTFVVSKPIEEIKTEIKSKEDNLIELTIKKSNTLSTNNIKNLELSIDKLSFQIEQLQTVKTPKREKLEQLKQTGTEIAQELSEQKNVLENIESNLERMQNDVVFYEEKRKKLYAEYDEEYAKQFTDNTCAYCKQALPTNKIEELSKLFDEKKASNLAEIVKQGKQIKSEIDSLTAKVLETKELLKGALEKKASIENELKKTREEWQIINASKDENPNQAKIEALNAEIITLTQQKNALITSEFNAINPYEEEERKLREEIINLNREMINYEQQLQNKKRIAELEQELKNARSGLSKNERILSLYDKYIITKTSLVTETINSHFELVNFKMFDYQVNGGINEVCTATVNGVDYADLNNAMKINAGLDIIRSLQKIYGVIAPIFIDNAESVTKFIELPNTQFIKLYVSEEDKLLRFERKETL